MCTMDPGQNVSHGMELFALLSVLFFLFISSGCTTTGQTQASVSGTVTGDYTTGPIYVVALDADRYGPPDIRVMETGEHPEQSEYVTAFTVLMAPGAFKIDGLPAGNYTLYAWADTDDNGWIDHAAYRDPTGWHSTGERLGPGTRSLAQGDSLQDVGIRLVAPVPYPTELNISVGEGGGRLTVMKDRPVLQLYGTPDEQAYAMGYLTGPQIKDWIEYVLIETFYPSAEEYDDIFIPYLKAHMTGVLAERGDEFDAVIEGMEARGVDLYSETLGRNLTREDILAENAYSFLLYFRLYGLAMGDLNLGNSSVQDGGISPHLCSSAIAWGNRTENDELGGGVIHGKNMDGETDLRKVTVNSLLIVASEPPAGSGQKRVVGFDWPGFIGTFNGMNEDGLVLVPHSSPSIPAWNETNMLPYVLLYMDTLQGESSVDGAWEYWQTMNQTRTGGHNAGVSMPYLNTSGSAAVCFEADSYGGAERKAGFIEPEDPFSLIIANNFYQYRGANPEAVSKVQGYHETIEPRDYRYLAMLDLFNEYEEENRTIGTPEMIALMQAASTSEEYQGITEYTFLAYPDQGAFAVATEDLVNHTLDAPFAPFTRYSFEEVF